MTGGDSASWLLTGAAEPQEDLKEVGHPPVGMAGALEEERGLTNAFEQLDGGRAGKVWPSGTIRCS